MSERSIGIILIALMVILIFWIMLEGCKIREEQQLTVQGITMTIIVNFDVMLAKRKMRSKELARTTKLSV